MESGDVIIVTPKNLRFQAPLKFRQNRLLCILNPTAEQLLYHVHSSNESYYKVSPKSGQIESYDTIELTITLEGASEVLPDGFFEIKYMPVTEEAVEVSEHEWFEDERVLTATVTVSLDEIREDEQLKNTLRSMVQVQGDGWTSELVKTLEQHKLMVCSQCVVHQAKPKCLKRTGLSFWLTIFFASGAVVYCLRHKISDIINWFIMPDQEVY